jgi:putative nucleotidyltransferase with HDIG domain
MNLVPQVLRSLKNLPPFPTVAHRALLLFNQPEVSIQELVEVVKFDPAITANILRICNSAYFARHRGIQSLHEALLLLGTHELLKIIVLSGVTRLFADPTPGYYSERLGLWRHSVSCALMMDLLARKLSLADQANGFTAGLLHDIGKVVLGLFVEQKFAEIMEVVEKQGVSFRAGEKVVLGIDHAEMGGEMARLWNFPDSLRMAIAYHHLDKPEAYTEDLILLVYLADQLALMFGKDLGPDGLGYTGHPEVLPHFHLQESDLESILLEFGTMWDESQACFGLSPDLEKNPQAQIES